MGKRLIGFFFFFFFPERESKMSTTFLPIKSCVLIWVWGIMTYMYIYMYIYIYIYILCSKEWKGKHQKKKQNFFPACQVSYSH